MNTRGALAAPAILPGRLFAAEGGGTLKVGLIGCGGRGSGAASQALHAEVQGKGVHVQPTVYGGRYVDPVPNVGRYFPSSGHLPGYGRLEIEPPANRKLPQEAESYYRSWSAQSTPQIEIPQNPPPVIVAPQIDYDWQHGRHPGPRPRPR